MAVQREERDAPRAGISSQEAAARLARYGPNVLAPHRPRRLVLEFLARFRNPLVLLLLTASAVSALTGEVESFVIITAIVVVSVTLWAAHSATVRSSHSGPESSGRQQRMSPPDYDAAAARDRRTAATIVAADPMAIADDDACGAQPVRGLLLAARRHGLRVHLLDLRSSGDTAGDRDRVVGYGAFAVG